MEAKNITGQQFGKWTALSFSHKDKNRQHFWLCRCDCGKIKTVEKYSLQSGKSKNCKNCMNKTHGLRYHILYKLLLNIKQRCYNTKSKNYKDYGGRGIIVCDEWLNNPKAFVDFCMLHGWSKELQIDRTNNNGNYEPNNCRFVTCQVNNQNQRTTKLNIDKIKSIKFLLKQSINQKEIAELYNVSHKTISNVKLGLRWSNVT